jgi:hypothetical protein
MDHFRALLFSGIRTGRSVCRSRRSLRCTKTLAVMDLHQAQVAHGLGEGHRIIRGVAGSGKTLILAFRAEYLARVSNKPVLILCYANGIAGRLEDVMQERGVEDRVQGRTFPYSGTSLADSTTPCSSTRRMTSSPSGCRLR